MIGKYAFRGWIGLFAAVALAAPSYGAKPTPRPSKVIGTYFNEGRIFVELNLISKDGKEGSIIPLPAGRIDRAVISGGLTKVYIPSEEMAKRRLLSTSQTPTPKSAPEFLETETRTFYFRVVGGKVTLVKPQNLTADERLRLRGYKRELRRAGVYDN